MALSVNLLGILQSYVASGATIEDFYEEQEVAEEDRARAQVIWDSIVEGQKQNPGRTMLVPAD